MTSLTDSLAFTVPLTAADRAQAKQFAAQMPHADKAQQVERNTLAVIATHYYLKLLGFTSSLDTSRSWNFLHQLTEDIADLATPTGPLNCCPIRPGQTVLQLPEFSDGIGCVAVQLDDDFHSARMLGFASVGVRSLSLAQLSPLDVLIDRLTEPPLVRLRDWLENQANTAWQRLDQLMSPERQPHLVFASVDLQTQSDFQQQRQLTIQSLCQQAGRLASTEDPTKTLSQIIQSSQDDELRWRAAELLWEIDPNHPVSPAIRAKDLGLYLSGHSLALVVGLLPKTDGQALVLMRICSIGVSPTLPSGIQFTGQDEDGDQIFDLSSRQQDDYIQFKFTADVGDLFSLTVRLGEAQVVEYFLV